MKKFIIILSLLLMSAGGAWAQAESTIPEGSTNANSKSVVSFKEVNYNFGKVAFGSDVSHTFNFKNVSKERINIREVVAACGCTTPKYSTDPIKPNRKGSILVKYDSKRVGHFTKTLSVLMSDQERITITIEGEILPETK